MIVSPSGKPKSTSTSSTRKPPVARGEPGHKTFPVHEWWKGFSKQSSRTNLQIGGGMFKIGAGKNDGELSLPFPQILRMRVSWRTSFRFVFLFSLSSSLTFVLSTGLEPRTFPRLFGAQR